MESIEENSETAVTSIWKKISIVNSITEIYALLIEPIECSVKCLQFLKSLKEIVDQTYQVEGDGFNVMRQEDIKELITSHDNGLTEGKLIKVVEGK